MRYVRPAWCAHKGEKHTNLPIYAIHVHPDCSRIATGAIDGKVRVWSTACFDEEAEQDESTPKLLCTMHSHTGVVLCLEFSGNGKYLASGSDDKVVVVWELDSSGLGLGKVFGSEEVNVENWKAKKRLVGHENDVQDLAWSSDSHLLVSVGLDSAIFVWSGETFNLLKRIEAHLSHVKGITFDPAGKFFATESDDKSVKIFNTKDFHIEATIQEPFKESPSTTYFRRPSWSPDGAHIAAANASNSNVSTVAIIERGSWSSEISLVGHEAPVEVTAFNPRLFSSKKDDRPAFYTIIAAAGQDRVLSIWDTSSARPIVVLSEISEKSISDMCWSPDGFSLFLSSYDGSVLLCSFLPSEIGHVLPLAYNCSVLDRYGQKRKGLDIPESPTQFKLEQQAHKAESISTQQQQSQQLNTPGSKAENQPDAGPPKVAKSDARLISPAVITTKPFVQSVTITKDGRKRVAPQLLSVANNATPPTRFSRPSADAIMNGRASGTTPYLDLTPPSAILPEGGVQSLIISSKRKSAVLDDSQKGPISQKKAKIDDAADQENQDIPQFIRPAIISPATSYAKVRLGVPAVVSFVKFSREGNTILEGRNGTHERNPAKMSAMRDGEAIWTDFLPANILLLSGSYDYSVAACEDGALYVWTQSGRRCLPPIILDSAPCFLEQRDHLLLCITTVGQLHAWNLQTKSALHPPVSLAPILDSSYESGSGTTRGELASGPSIIQVSMMKSGHTIISLSNGEGFVYSTQLLSWLRISDPWWAVGSQYWDTLGLSKTSSIGPVGLLERRTDNQMLKTGRGRVLQRIIQTTVTMRDGFEQLESVVSVRHLENRIAAAEMLDCEQEYAESMLLYVKRLADEGQADRISEICSMLWESRRILLRSVLLVLGRYRDLQRITGWYFDQLERDM